MTPHERYLAELRRMPAPTVEARVLAALFTDPACLARAFALGLDDEDFTEPGNRAVFAAIRELVADEAGAEITFHDVVQAIALRGETLGLAERGRAAEQQLADLFANAEPYELAFATPETRASAFDADLRQLRAIADARKAV